ncbi:FAD-dependent oxidoreductase [Aeromicrobium sp. CTD01-1L150]|uniref:FAD-dependent oxidoreductase n=1 Tax=Aeromicrobium sp. CTD01-1L150 TaxID=3341830 RepID=UPI0035C1BFF2
MNADHSPSTTSPAPSPDASVDVLVVGGGAAGLATALVLARSRRSVVLVDAGEQRNAPAAHMHNYLGRESAPPLELVADGRREVEQYGARVLRGRVVAIETQSGPTPSFTATLEGEDADGTRLTARRVVLATGVVDELPDVPGLAERWGRDVLHCPYCHGWEVRDRRIGILQTSPAAMHQVGLFRQLSDRVVLLAADGDSLGHGEREQLAARDVRVVDDTVTEVLVEDDVLVGVGTSSGEVVGLDALVVASVPHARTELADALGVMSKPMEMGGTVVATTLEADPMTGATNVPGVHVVGNASAPMATVVASSASGTQVGAFINAALVEEDTATAVESLRAAMREPAAWDERYSPDHESVWSGNVNPQLPAHTADLPRERRPTRDQQPPANHPDPRPDQAPGGDAGPWAARRTALDVGCGEGGDAIWLAREGWETTGMDFSAAGLERAAEHARSAGVDVTWRLGDARTWEPDGEQWDLVTAHYLHLPHEPMLDVVRRLAAAVAPGGTLLVVGHHPDDVPSATRPRDDMFLAEDLQDAVPSGWELWAGTADRTGTGVGAHVHVRDTVLKATRPS